MELRHIRCALEVAKHLNFTRAAQFLNITQPALTRTIMQLEQELGGRIFHRRTRTIGITELGRLILPYFREVVSQVETARQHANQYFGIRKGSLAIGIMCTLGPFRFLPLFKSFRERNPRVRVRFVDGPAHALRTALAAGEIDVAILGLPEPLGEEFTAVPLYDEPFVIAVGTQHKFATRARVRVKDLHQEDYLYRENCEFADFLDEIFAQQGVSPQYPYGSARDDWIQVMVRAGFGFSFFPKFSVNMEGVLPIPLVAPAITRRINLVMKNGERHAPPLGAFAAEALMWKNALPSAGGKAR